MNQPSLAESAGLINPSLTIAAEFRTAYDGRDLTTVFELRSEPGIAAWLSSFADHYLALQGKPGGKRGIAPPPAGDVQQRLLRGGIIIATTLPDGRPSLRLNSDQSIWLNLKVRRGGQPALHSAVAIYDEPGIARWLLSYSLGADEMPTAPDVIDGLRKYGVIVDELPPDPVRFPDPSAPADLTAELETADEVWFQPAGQPVPVEVRSRLGLHTPALPKDTDIVWGRDAGNGLLLPSRMSADLSRDAVRRLAGRYVTKRGADWQRQTREAEVSLRERRYAILKEIIPPAHRAGLRRYLRALIERGYFPKLGDGQVELRAALHNQQTIASLHRGLAEMISRFAGQNVVPSFCYLSLYESGAVLERHVDRPQCLYNLSMPFDMIGEDGEPEPWPIYLEIEGQSFAVELELGDGLVYSGTELAHWRDALPVGQRAVICFFHFVTPEFDGSLH